MLKFRTEIEKTPCSSPLAPDETLVSLGSCFSRAIGDRLKEGGIAIDVTPMGILFNPISIGRTIQRMMSGREYTVEDLYKDSAGIFHLLDYESRRQNADPEKLLKETNADFRQAAQNLRNAGRWLITFGTAWCFRHIPSDKIVGNCHKLPDSEFEKLLCSVDEIVELWSQILPSAPGVIFTISPVRHLNDGLHGNTLSKARLHLAVEKLCSKFKTAEYFPAYEALVDDLRDYRFYSDDLKHPSAMAEEYIFEKFTDRYYTPRDIAEIQTNRRKARQERHRPIIT